MKIRNIEDIKAAGQRIIEKLIAGKLTYFNLSVWENDSSSESACFFTPVTQLQLNRLKPGEPKQMIMVDDYEKIMKLLLSHPKIKDLNYIEKGNCVCASFDSPYPSDYDLEEERAREDEDEQGDDP
jgi:hypothetical protein